MLVQMIGYLSSVLVFIVGHGGLWLISDLVATLGRLKASNPHALTIPRRSACSREDRHHLHVPTAAFGANEPPMFSLLRGVGLTHWELKRRSQRGVVRNHTLRSVRAETCPPAG